MHLVYINCCRLCSTVLRINQKLSCFNLDVWNLGSDVSHQFEFATFFDALYCSKLQISNRPDTNHVSVVQLSGHLAGIVIGVVAITSTIALATQLILRGRWFRRHGYPSELSFEPAVASLCLDQQLFELQYAHWSIGQASRCETDVIQFLSLVFSFQSHLSHLS